MVPRYVRSATQARSARVVVLMSIDDVKEIDSWGVPAGMPSRGAAVRALIKKGLEADKKERRRAVAVTMAGQLA